MNTSWSVLLTAEIKIGVDNNYEQHYENAGSHSGIEITPL